MTVGEARRWAAQGRLSEDSPAAAEVRGRQLASFVRHTPVNAGASLVNAGIIGVIYWDYLPHGLLLVWLGLIVGPALWHLARWYRRRHKPQPVMAGTRGLRRAVFWSILAGLCWGGMALFVLFVPGLYWLLAVIMTLGMVAGSAATLAAVPMAAAGFIVSALAPWTILFLINADPFFEVISLMALVFMLATLATVRSVHLAVMDTIRVKHANAQLLAQFHAERDEWLELSDTSEAFALFDDSNSLLLWNENYRRILELPQESLHRSAKLEDLLSAAAVPVEVQRGQKTLDEWVEEQVRRVTDTEFSAIVYRLGNGRWLRASCRKTRRGRRAVLLVDITELKERERALMTAHRELQHSERRFQDFAESSADWFWEMGPDLRFSYMSPNVERLVGFSPEAHYGKTRRELMSEGFDEEVLAQHEKILEARQPFRDFVFCRKGMGQSPRWLRTSGIPIFAEDGKFLGYRGTASDVTLTVEAQEALRASERQLRLVTDSLPVLITALDRDQRYTFVNRTCEKWYGHPQSELIGRTVREVQGENYEIFQPHIEAALAGEERSFEQTILYGDGVRRTARVIYVPYFAADGAVDGIFSLVEDITSRRAAEAERAIAQKTLVEREAHLRDLQHQLELVSRQSAMGQLSSALAHELNQPLAAIMNYVQASRRLLEGDPPSGQAKVLETLAKALEQANRASDVIRRVRGLFGGVTERSHHQINQVVEDAAALAFLDAGARKIAYHLKLSDGLPTVNIDRIQIQQVVLNLVRNAVEALATSQRREILIETGKGTDGNVVFSVSDTGPGLPDEVAGRLFEPFVTGKRDGMGIGLSISQRIVEAHDGQISAEPQPEGGMRFQVVLPAADEARAA